MDSVMKELINHIKGLVGKKIDISRELSDEDVLSVIDDCIREVAQREYISMDNRLQIRAIVFNFLRKMDILTPYIEDEEITEIMCNGPDNIFIEKNGVMIKVNDSFDTEERLLDIIRRIASDVGRVINESSPIVDARLKDGSRVNAVLPPVSLNGPLLTIRKFSKEVITMDKIIQDGEITEEAADFLKKLIYCGYNLIISGGTSSGKTTLLNALSEAIDDNERVIVVEDTNELRIRKKNCVSMEVKAGGAKSEEISIRTLIKTALRMRPDRLIVGEVRGKEAIDMLQALNTGHSGLSTGHSNSAKDMLSRIETMILLEESIPLMAVRSQIVSAIDIIVSVQRFADGSRRVTQIVETKAVKQGEIVLNVLYDYDIKEKKLIKRNELINIDKLLLKEAGV